MSSPNTRMREPCSVQRQRLQLAGVVCASRSEIKCLLSENILSLRAATWLGGRWMRRMEHADWLRTLMITEPRGYPCGRPGKRPFAQRPKSVWEVKVQDQRPLFVLRSERHMHTLEPRRAKECLL